MPLKLDGTYGVYGVVGTASSAAFYGDDADSGIIFPDANTVAVVTNGSEKVRVGAAGSVGIGTTIPNRPLHINGLGNLGTQVQINSTSESAGITLFPQPGNNYEIQATGASVAEGNSFIVYDRTNSAYRMIIDSAGRVKMPYQPACDVYGTGTCTVTDGTSQNLPLTTFNYNRGFSITSSKLVIPKTGYYSITTNYISQIGGSTYSIRAIKIFPRINGTVLTYPDPRWNSAPSAGFSNTHYEIKHNWILNLAENDQLDLQVIAYHNKGSALSETYYTSIIANLLG